MSILRNTNNFYQLDRTELTGKALLVNVSTEELKFL